MKITTKTDALGAIFATSNVDADIIRNNGGSTINFDIQMTNATAQYDESGDILISLGLNAVCIITYSDQGSWHLETGKTLKFKKTTAGGLYTPEITQETNDPVWLRDGAMSANIAISRITNYWLQATQLVGLGLASLVGVKASAKVDINADSVQVIAGSIQAGRVNFIGS